MADETYIKVCDIKTYVWLVMNAACRSIIGYHVSDSRGVGSCILAIRIAFQGLKKLLENFKLVADGYSAHLLAAMEFAKKFGKDFSSQNTQVIGLTNYDLALWVAYYNFLRQHKYNGYKVLNDMEMLHGADNMPTKWQILIFLGQHTIMNMQKNGTASQEQSCCQ